MSEEIGWLPVSRDGAVLFFQLVNAATRVDARTSRGNSYRMRDHRPWLATGFAVWTTAAATCGGGARCQAHPDGYGD